MTFLESFIDWQKESPSSDKFIVWTAMSILGAAVNRKVWINYNGYEAYPNIFVMLVAPAGLGKKTTIARTAYQLLQGLPGVNILPESITAQSMLHAMSERSLNYRVRIKGKPGDFQSGASYLFASEALNLLKPRSFGNMTEILTELYDCDPNGWHKDVPFVKSTLKDGAIQIFNPCINFLGCTTPQILVEEIIKKSQIDSGFASRVLFAYESKSSGKNTVWRDEENSAEYERVKEILKKRVAEINNNSGPITVSSDVRTLHDEYVRKNEDASLKHAKSRLVSIYGRKPIHVLKLAQLFCVSRGGPLTIKTDDWLNAVTLVEEAHMDTLDLFSGISKIDNSMLLYKIWEEFRYREHEFTMAEVFEEFWHTGTRDNIQNAVFMLVSMKRILASSRGNKVYYKVVDDSKLK